MASTNRTAERKKTDNCFGLRYYKVDITKSILFACFLMPLLLVNPDKLKGQEYLWPTNASNYLSASFCEYRPGHYHSAIDVKTWNSEGYPCYAVDDGYIKRIRVSAFGYGKVIYFQLKDGNTAVYAHLQKFSDDIEKQVRDMQFKNQKYQLNWWPENIRVKRGDIIAYTGRTGIGVPHLHFEIRNKEDNPVNPQQYYPQISDHIRPRLQALGVIPLSIETKINNSFLPIKVPVHHIKDDVYIIRKPIYAEGKIGLAVKGYDQADGVANKYGFYQSTLDIDGIKSFQISYDILEFATTDHINTELYYPWLSGSKERFHKLYLESFNPLPFYDRLLEGDGTIEIRNEPVAFTISIVDYKGNRSVLAGEILPSYMMNIQVINIVQDENWINIDFKAPKIQDLNFLIKSKDGEWAPARYFELIDSRINVAGDLIRTRINKGIRNIEKVKIRVNGTIEETINLEPSKINNRITYNIHHQGKYLVIDGPDFLTANNVSLVPGNKTLKNFIKSENKTEILIPAEYITGVPSALMVLADSTHFWSRDLDYQSLLPNQTSSSSWFDSSLVLTSYPGSVLDTNLVTVNILPRDTLLSEFNIASSILHILPDNFPIYKSVTITIRADSIPAWGNWSVYKNNGNGHLSFLPSKLDSNKMTFKTQTSSLGRFVIASDTIPPVIVIKSPKNGMTYRKTPKIRLDIADALSGIGSENDINLLMDGEYVLQEWDPEEDMLNGILEKELESGNHVFTVSVRDRAGNINYKVINFKLE